jgi:peroxiredoxin Q/BCP
MPVKVGDTAPDFTLSSQSGTPVSLKDFLGKNVSSSTFIPKMTHPDALKNPAPFVISMKSLTLLAQKS